MGMSRVRTFHQRRLRSLSSRTYRSQAHRRRRPTRIIRDRGVLILSTFPRHFSIIEVSWLSPTVRKNRIVGEGIYHDLAICRRPRNPASLKSVVSNAAHRIKSRLSTGASVCRRRIATHPPLSRLGWNDEPRPSQRCAWECNRLGRFSASSEAGLHGDCKSLALRAR